MDEEGIAAVAVSGVVPRPLENYVLLFCGIYSTKDVVTHTNLVLGLSYGKLCNAFLMLEFIQKKHFIKEESFYCLF